MSSMDGDSNSDYSALEDTVSNVDTSYTSFNTSSASAEPAATHKYGSGRQADERREARKKEASTEEGRARRRAKRQQIIDETTALLQPQIDRAVEEARAIRSAAVALPTPALTSSAHTEFATDAFIQYLNVVRGVSSSKRYPLTATSPHLATIFDCPASLRVLTLMAKEGYLFDPSKPEYGDVLLLDEGEEMEGVEEEEGTDVTFKFYSRATPLTAIDTLQSQLNELEELHPNYTIWTYVVRDQLDHLLKSGHKEARVFYHGTTVHSVHGREHDTREGDLQLVAHWKAVTGQPMEIYHWRQLDRICASRYVFRNDESVSGIEEVLVDVGGGHLLTLNQQSGGFANRIVYHPLLISVRQAIQALRAQPMPLEPALQTASPVIEYDPVGARQRRISNLLIALAQYCAKHPKDFGGVIATNALLEQIAEMAGRIELDGRNAVRAHMLKDQPKEVFYGEENKLYDSAIVGRGPHNDRMIEEEARGLIDLITGQPRPGVEAIDHRFPFLDLWCITYKHPDWWIIVHIIVLVFWVHILRPKYIVLGAAKLAGLVQRDIFSSVFKEDDVAVLENKLDTYFSNESDSFDAAFLASILADPMSCPATEPPALTSRRNKQAIAKAEAEKEARALLVTVLLEWEELPIACYITWVGTPFVAQLGPLSSSYFPAVGALHGGYHAYQGWTRPLSMQLSQAVQLMADLLELVTTGIEMDGSKEQAERVVEEVEELAVETGLKQAMDDIRKELLAACWPLWSLIRLSIDHRKDAGEFDEESWNDISTHFSAAHQSSTAASIKAVGARGSPERAAQASQLVQENRDAINARTLLKLHPCPASIAQGPASPEAWLWYTLYPEETSSFLRAANGTKSAGLTGSALQHATLSKSLAKIKYAREHEGTRDAYTLRESQAIEFLEQGGKGIEILECSHCEKILYAKDKWFLRHACSEKRTEELVDLDAVAEKVKDLKEKAREETEATARVGAQSASDRKNISLQIAGYSPNGDSRARWESVSQDETIQQYAKDASNGSLHIPGSEEEKEGKKVERHGRLRAGDLLWRGEVTKPEALNQFIMNRICKTCYPWP